MEFYCHWMYLKTLMFVLKIFLEIFKEGSKLLFQMLISCSCEVQDISTSVNNVITMNLSICLL